MNLGDLSQEDPRWHKESRSPFSHDREIEQWERERERDWVCERVTSHGGHRRSLPHHQPTFPSSTFFHFLVFFFVQNRGDQEREWELNGELRRRSMTELWWRGKRTHSGGTNQHQVREKWRWFYFEFSLISLWVWGSNRESKNSFNQKIPWDENRASEMRSGVVGDCIVGRNWVDDDCMHNLDATDYLLNH